MAVANITSTLCLEAAAHAEVSTIGLVSTCMIALASTLSALLCGVGSIKVSLTCAVHSSPVGHWVAAQPMSITVL